MSDDTIESLFIIILTSVLCVGYAIREWLYAKQETKEARLKLEDTKRQTELEEEQLRWEERYNGVYNSRELYNPLYNVTTTFSMPMKRRKIHNSKYWRCNRE